MDLKNNKPHKAGMNLGKVPPKNWAKLAYAAATGLPILTRPMKGASFYTISVRIDEGLQRKAEVARDSSERFKTMSDVYRAAFYIGLNMVYEALAENELAENKRLKTLFELMRMDEETNQNMLGLDHVVNLAAMKKRHIEAGLITKDDFQDWIDTVMEALPVSLRDKAMDKIKRIMRGERQKDLYECIYDPTKSVSN